MQLDRPATIKTKLNKPGYLQGSILGFFQTHQLGNYTLARFYLILSCLNIIIKLQQNYHIAVKLPYLVSKKQ